MKSLGGLRNQGRLLAKTWGRWRRPQRPEEENEMTTEDASLTSEDWDFVGGTSGTFYNLSPSLHCIPEVVP